MIDNGAVLNVIKIGALRHNTSMISGDVMNPLFFINPRTGQSLGKIKIIGSGEAQSILEEKGVEQETLNIITRNILPAEKAPSDTTILLANLGNSCNWKS